MKISCIEEIAFRMGYISRKQLLDIGNKMNNNQYGDYIKKIANESM